VGSRYKDVPIGGHGNLTCFSFHPGQVVTTGEGGVITTNDAGYAELLRSLRQHGMSVSDVGHSGASTVSAEQYLCVGYNCRMTDLQAAIGIEQLKKLDWIVARRCELARRYTDALAGHPWLTPPQIPEYAQLNFQSYAVRLRSNAPFARNDIMQRLMDQGIATGRGIMLAHREPPYVGRADVAVLRRSERASDNSMLLPIYPTLETSAQDHVIRTLNSLALRRAA
jgi:dTDP-4-amino-4,6-dideoxygalactose transaminase